MRHLVKAYKRVPHFARPFRQSGVSLSPGEMLMFQAQSTKPLETLPLTIPKGTNSTAVRKILLMAALETALTWYARGTAFMSASSKQRNQKGLSKIIGGLKKQDRTHRIEFDSYQTVP